MSLSVDRGSQEFQAAIKDCLSAQQRHRVSVPDIGWGLLLHHIISRKNLPRVTLGDTAFHVLLNCCSSTSPSPLLHILLILSPNPHPFCTSPRPHSLPFSALPFNVEVDFVDDTKFGLKLVKKTTVRVSVCVCVRVCVCLYNA